MRGVEKPRNTYYLDETEAQRDGTAFRAPLQVGTRELVSLMSQFLAFCLQNDIFFFFNFYLFIYLFICKMISFNIEMAIKVGLWNGTEETVSSGRLSWNVARQ